MTAVDTAPRAPRAVFVAPGRLVRLEARRNAMLLLLPLVVAMFWFDTYQTAMATPNVWGTRGYIFQRHLLFDFAPFIAGAAAWSGSRDSRRDMLDMVTITSRPRWVTLLASLSATIGWALLGYAVCVAALYSAIAGRHPFGTVPWWPLVVGAASVIVLCALGFVAGVFFPGRFAAPVIAIIALLLVEVGSRSVAVSNRSSYALLSPTNAESQTVTLFPDLGLFYPDSPDLSIVQVMFLIGITVVLLGLMGLPAVAGGPRLRVIAALAAVAGLALTGTAVHLAGTAQATATGMMSVPALHQSAEDQPIVYHPVCTGAAIPVCVHPAFAPPGSGQPAHPTTTARPCAPGWCSSWRWRPSHCSARGTPSGTSIPRQQFVSSRSAPSDSDAVQPPTSGRGMVNSPDSGSAASPTTTGAGRRSAGGGRTPRTAGTRRPAGVDTPALAHRSGTP
ncbi:hypothetical protein [Catenulispora subtropica]|uniref:Uncharacterized protein n=1 Tax=Catenulispora subtropica TaxID=450798 RepID=A0ABN2S1Y2_9ACTN